VGAAEEKAELARQERYRGIIAIGNQHSTPSRRPSAPSWNSAFPPESTILKFRSSMLTCSVEAKSSVLPYLTQIRSFSYFGFHSNRNTYRIKSTKRLYTTDISFKPTPLFTPTPTKVKFQKGITAGRTPIRKLYMRKRKVEFGAEENTCSKHQLEKVSKLKHKMD
ncbi:hypothetical protein BHM03_00038615, partial [Ensete ventricosum]